MRLKNLTSLVIGQHLIFGDRAYGLKLTAAETKTGRPYVAAVPPELTPYIDGWLQVHRPHMQSIARGKGEMGSNVGHLWVDRGGRPMSGKAIRDQIKSRTRQAFGKAIWPHLFRDCAVTELVDCAPEQIGIAPDLLGHSDLQTTKKHYIQAVGMKAHAKVQEVIAARRRGATGRGNQVPDKRRSVCPGGRVATPDRVRVPSSMGATGPATSRCRDVRSLHVTSHLSRRRPSRVVTRSRRSPSKQPPQSATTSSRGILPSPSD